MLRSLMNSGFSLENILSFLVQTVLMLPAIIVSLSFHEAAHAFAAYRCGDSTAKYYGRLTLNPLKHIDPVGFGMLLLFGFGYAKPVPVNPGNFRRGRRDDVFVSVAGIATNLLLCLLSCAIFIFCYILAYRTGNFLQINRISYLGIPTSGWALAFTIIGDFITINLSLAIFNLLPIPPLDGFHIFNDLVLRGNAAMSRMSAQFGQIVILVLLFSGVIGRVINFFFDRLLYVIGWAISMLL